MGKMAYNSGFQTAVAYHPLAVWLRPGLGTLLKQDFKMAAKKYRK
ncbi:hypothetical protein [Bacillus sp. M6-12]|nr:hypothetical protein [Bacillus sp. M6-12]